MKKKNSIQDETVTVPFWKQRFYIFSAVAIVVILVVYSFKVTHPSSLYPRDYCHWVQNSANGLNVKKTIGDFQFALQYKPCAYIALMQDKKDSIAKAVVDERVKKMDGLQYYTFTITTNTGEELMRTGIKSETEYYDRLDYIESMMQNDFSLIDGKDTLPCVLFHFERNYNIAPFNNFLLGFELTKDGATQTNKTVLYDDHLLGTGPVLITVSGDDIAALPNLKFLR